MKFKFSSIAQNGICWTPGWSFWSQVFPKVPTDSLAFSCVIFRVTSKAFPCLHRPLVLFLSFGSVWILLCLHSDCGEKDTHLSVACRGESEEEELGLKTPEFSDSSWADPPPWLCLCLNSRHSTQPGFFLRGFCSGGGSSLLQPDCDLWIGPNSFSERQHCHNPVVCEHCFPHHSQDNLPLQRTSRNKTMALIGVAKRPRLSCVQNSQSPIFLTSSRSPLICYSELHEINSHSWHCHSWCLFVKRTCNNNVANSIKYHLCRWNILDKESEKEVKKKTSQADLCLLCWEHAGKSQWKSSSRNQYPFWKPNHCAHRIRSCTWALQSWVLPRYDRAKSGNIDISRRGVAFKPVVVLHHGRIFPARKYHHSVLRRALAHLGASQGDSRPVPGELCQNPVQNSQPRGSAESEATGGLGRVIFANDTQTNVSSSLGNSICNTRQNTMEVFCILHVPPRRPELCVSREEERIGHFSQLRCHVWQILVSGVQRGHPLEWENCHLSHRKIGTESPVWTSVETGLEL